MVVKSDDDAYVDLYEARTLGEAHMDTREYRCCHDESVAEVLCYTPF